MDVLVAHESARSRAHLDRLGRSLRTCRLTVTSTVREAAACLSSERLDLVLLSGNLVALDPAEVARMVSARSSTIYIVAANSELPLDSDRHQSVGAAGDAGQNVDETTTVQELSAVLRVFGGGMMARVASGASDRRGVDARIGHKAGASGDRLTTAERAVLHGLAGGSTTSGLADDLGLPEEEVDAHVSSIIDKLHRRSIQPVRS